MFIFYFELHGLLTYRLLPPFERCPRGFRLFFRFSAEGAQHPGVLLSHDFETYKLRQNRDLSRFYEIGGPRALVEVRLRCVVVRANWWLHGRGKTEKIIWCNLKHFGEPSWTYWHQIPAYLLMRRLRSTNLAIIVARRCFAILMNKSNVFSTNISKFNFLFTIRGRNQRIHRLMVTRPISTIYSSTTKPTHRKVGASSPPNMFGA